MLTKSNAMGNEKEPEISVGLLLYEGVELLNFAGPGEVFASTKGFKVFTMGLNTEPIKSQGFITLLPEFSMKDFPPADILVIPGGNIEDLLENQQLLCWLRACSIKSQHILSICTGAGLLAKAGLLNWRKATTFHDYKEKLQELAPTATILSDARFADNGQVITTAGISAGIDGALHLIARIKGREVALQTAKYMEYAAWQPSKTLA